LENELTEENPTAVLRRKKHGYSYKPVRSRAVPRDDYLKVMHAMPAFTAHRAYHPRDLRDAAMVSLVADSSARRGELWELRRKDLAEALRLGADVGGGVTVYHVITRGKTGAVTIRFFAETAELLRRWLQHVPPDSPFVFISLRTGKRLRLDAMWLGFKRICEFAGVPPFRFHATRKRVVTDIIESSGDMKVGQLLANHRSPRTTQEYYNDIQQSRVDAAAGALAGQRAAPRTDIASAFFGRVDRR
jgi:integrase